MPLVNEDGSHPMITSMQGLLQHSLLHSCTTFSKTPRYPDDMDDDSMLVPVDLSSEPEDFPNTCEDLTAKAHSILRIAGLLMASESCKMTARDAVLSLRSNLGRIWSVF